MTTLKDGFQTSIRNIVAYELNEKKLQTTNHLEQHKENLTKMQKQIDDRGLIIEEQEDIIESKDDAIQKMKSKVSSLIDENRNLQNIIEKHRINGIQLQEENENLRVEIERVKKLEEEILEKCDALESTDQDMAQALKEIRDQEIIDYQHRFEKHSKNVPKLNLEKVHEIIKMKCDESNMSYTEEGEEEESQYDNSDRLSFEIKRYYSERNYGDEQSDDEVSNYKNNIRMLLQSSIKKIHDEDQDKSERTNLFDYEPKTTTEQLETFNDEESIHNKPMLEQIETTEENEMIENDKYMLYDDSSSS